MYTHGLLTLILISISILLEHSIEGGNFEFPAEIRGTWHNTAYSAGSTAVTISAKTIEPFGSYVSGSTIITLAENGTKWDCKVCFAFKIMDTNLIEYKKSNCISKTEDCTLNLGRNQLFSLLRIDHEKKEQPSVECPFWEDYEMSFKDFTSPECSYDTSAPRTYNGVNSQMLRCGSRHQDKFIMRKEHCQRPNEVTVMNITCIARYKRLHTSKMIIHLSNSNIPYRCAEYSYTDGDVLKMKVFLDARCRDHFEYDMWYLKKKAPSHVDYPTFMSRVLRWRSLDATSSIVKIGDTAYNYTDGGEAWTARIRFVKNYADLDNNNNNNNNNKHHRHVLLAELKSGCTIKYKCLIIRKVYKYAMEFNWSIFETAFPRTDLDCRKVKYESESHLFYADSKKSRNNLSCGDKIKGVYTDDRKLNSQCRNRVVIGCSTANQITMSSSCHSSFNMNCIYNWKHKGAYYVLASSDNSKQLNAYRIKKMKSIWHISTLRRYKQKTAAPLKSMHYKFHKRKECRKRTGHTPPPQPSSRQPVTSDPPPMKPLSDNDMHYRSITRESHKSAAGAAAAASTAASGCHASTALSLATTVMAALLWIR